MSNSDGWDKDIELKEMRWKYEVLMIDKYFSF